MRVVSQIPHPKFRITVFATEQYYYTEIEAGPMKQAYKLPKDKAANLAAVEKWLNEEFLSEVNLLFEGMYRAHLKSIRENL